MPLTVSAESRFSAMAQAGIGCNAYSYLRVVQNP